MKEKKILYYTDPVNDDFARNEIKTKKLPDNFRYVNRNPLFVFVEFILYELVARPLVTLYVKIKYRQKFLNKKAAKKLRKEGGLLYINHTNEDLDAFVPSMLSFPNKAFIVAHPDAFSIPFIKTLVKMLGGIPLPGTRKEYGRYKEAINYRLDKKKIVTIYPEAHIWPYYTDIRPFKSVSFNYAYSRVQPVYSVTNVYVRRKEGARPKVLSVVNGPFYIDNSLPRTEAVEKLRDEVYNSMVSEVNKREKYEYAYSYVKAGGDGEPERDLTVKETDI